jgi:hypothetical protein
VDDDGLTFGLRAALRRPTSHAIAVVRSRQPTCGTQVFGAMFGIASDATAAVRTLGAVR